MDGGVRNISYVIYVLVTHISQGAGDLVPLFLFVRIP